MLSVFHDMHGNVWEWVGDWHAEDYYARSPLDDPQGPESGEVLYAAAVPGIPGRSMPVLPSATGIRRKRALHACRFPAVA